MNKRQRCRVLFVVLGWIFSCFYLFPSVLQAQEVSFTIPEQFIDVKVNHDGSVDFTDYQYYDAEYMNGAIFTLDHQGYELSRFEVGVSETIDHPIHSLKESDVRQNHTYQLKKWNSGSTEAKVYYPLKNQGKYFVYQYRLERLVTNFQDVGELLRKFGTTDFTTDVKIRIQLPEQRENKEEVRAWGYGAPQGEVRIVDEDGKTAVYLTVPQRQSDQFLEGHILFPKEWTANNPNQVMKNRLQEVLIQAEAQVKKDAQALKQTQQLTYLIVAISAGFAPLLAGWALFYYRREKRKLNPNPQYVPDYLYDLPERISPAEMAVHHFRLIPTEDDFVATLLHLVQKGWLKIETIEGPKRKKDDLLITPLYQGEGYPKDMLVHEQFVWDYLTQLITDGSIRLGEINDRVKKSNKLRKKQYRYWQRFRNTLQTAGEKYRGPALEANRKLQVIIATATIALIIGLMFSIIFMLNHTAYLTKIISNIVVILCVGTGLTLLLLLLLFFLLRARPLLTTEQERSKKQWQAFAKMLKDIGQFRIREIASLPLWEEFLVYATSLGVADKVLKAIELEFTPAELANYGGSFQTMSQPYVFNQLIRSQINHSLQATTPPSSNSGGFSGTNSGGFGGGFSGGSMGGSGGGTHSGGF